MKKEAELLWEEGQTSAYYCRNLPGSETGTNLYCLVTEAHVCEQLAQGCYPAVSRCAVEFAT